MQKILQRVVLAAFLVLLCSVVNAQVFVQQGGKLYANGGLGAANFGSAVSVSADGNVAVIGAPGDGANIGAAYIWRRTGTTWSQEIKLVNYPMVASPYLPNQGNAVAISADGKTVAIGGYFDNRQGSVWIYRYSGGTWTLEKLIQGTANQELGTAVSLSGDGNTALIGNRYDNSAEVWHYIGGNWNKEAAITCSDAIPSTTGGAYAGVGKSVSLSADGNTALIGGDNDAYGVGAAWVFTRTGSAWTQQGNKITVAGLPSTAHFGCSVALSGDGITALIGAYGESAAYTFTRSGTLWTQQGNKITVNDAGANQTFVGSAISISNDGNTALLGGYADNAEIGASWIFTRIGNTWTQQGNKLIGSGFTGYANQGNGVSLSADGYTALVGGPSDDGLFGSAWAFVQSMVPDIKIEQAQVYTNACLGVASVNPNLGHFIVSGTSLSNDVVLTSSTSSFEISSSATSGFSNSLTLHPTAGTLNQTTIYVRSSAIAPEGDLTGTINIQSGSYNQSVQARGRVNTISIVQPVPDQTYPAGVPTAPLVFGSNAIVTWSPDNTTIGVPPAGINSIPSFTPVNHTANDLITTITVTPANPTGCNGPPIHFTIRVPAATTSPTVIVGPVTGSSIAACVGIPSANVQQFEVSGSNLTSDIGLSATPGFEVSLSPTTGFGGSVVVPRTAGSVSNTTICVRIAAGPGAGLISGSVNVNSGTFNQPVSVVGEVDAAPVLGPIDAQVVEVGIPAAINFQGTTNVSWTNSNTAIGLPATGMGSSIQFTPTGSGFANIVATPYNSTGCTGTPINFSITAVAAVPPGIVASGNVPQLSTVYGTPSTAGTFTVSGDNMRVGITVTPPTGFEVSTDDINFSKTLTVGKAGTIAPATVYIRLGKTAPVGTYPGDVVISSTGATDQKITLDDNNSVTPAPLIITADNKSKITGSANPALTVTYKGFVNGESAQVLKTAPIVSTTAVDESVPGPYPITVSGAVGANYTITYVDGTLTVKPQPLNVSLTNTFTPNGDGLNDTWVIKNIEGFPNCTVQIYSRYGVSVFHSVNYPVPWDGKSNGTDLPVGIYYYIIDLKNGDEPTTGWLAIVR